jgi:hypothetical protein
VTPRRDPAEERVAIEELEAVDERVELGPGAERGGAARRSGQLIGRVRVGGDERRPVRTRSGERRLEAGGEVDVAAKPDRDDVRGLERVGIVVGELEAGDDQQVVAASGTLRLPSTSERYAAYLPACTSLPARVVWSVIARTSNPLRPYRSHTWRTVRSPSLQVVWAWSSQSSGLDFVAMPRSSLHRRDFAAPFPNRYAFFTRMFPASEAAVSQASTASSSAS